MYHRQCEECNLERCILPQHTPYHLWIWYHLSRRLTSIVGHKAWSTVNKIKWFDERNIIITLCLNYESICCSDLCDRAIRLAILQFHKVLVSAAAPPHRPSDMTSSDSARLHAVSRNQLGRRAWTLCIQYMILSIVLTIKTKFSWHPGQAFRCVKSNESYIARDEFFGSLWDLYLWKRQNYPWKGEKSKLICRL